MAQITEVKLVDDLDGGEAAESVAFSLDGKSYEIDLNEQHAAALRDAFAPFISSARRAGNGSKVATRQRILMRAARSREDTAAIREWAHANGLVVSARGRILHGPRGVRKPRQRTCHPCGDDCTGCRVRVIAVEAVVDAEAKPKRRTRKKATAES